MIFVYTLGVVAEIGGPWFQGGVVGAFLVIDCLWLVVSCTAVAGMIYSNYIGNIKHNYWICIMMIVRICGGLLQPAVNGLNYDPKVPSSLVAGFISYMAMEGLLYFILNVSHRSKIIAPILTHILALGSFLFNIFFLLGYPHDFYDWYLATFLIVASASTIILKLYLFKKI